MKKTIIASLFVLLCVTSCDFLNEVPQDRLSPESYFKTETDLQLFTNPLYDNLLDKDAYELFMQKGIFDSETAMSFRRNILEMGGSDEPMELYRRFRGADPDPAALLRARGLK